MKKVLLIEDEKKVAAFLKKGLQEEGYQVSVAYDGPTGMALLTRQSADIIILDVVLPGISGLETCKKIRESGWGELPILMLTALGTIENIVEGLNTGADDYLVKPFKFQELLARINALVRRSDKSAREEQNNTFQFGDIHINDDAKKVSIGSEKVDLTATEYKLLLYLIKNKNKVLSREQILSNVWGIDFELSTNVVDVYVNYLRKKIKKGQKSHYIHTVIGMGYVIRDE